MKALNIAVTSLLLIAGESFAASTVSDVVARQRWPWSGKVDIDYTVTGDKTDVDFYATWDGQTTPVLIGTDFQIEAGQHRFEFDPALSGFAGKTTTGFAVTASPAGADAHKYLVLDLANGGYTYLAAPPEGGWTAEHKSTKMVFARVPAGTYKCGLDDNVFVNVFNVTDTTSYRKWWATRDVTFTSDYYMGVFIMTDAQYNQVVTGTASTTYTPKKLSYYDLRGSTNIADNADGEIINWPVTKYRVDSGSFIEKLRAKARGSLRIDLPEEEQWEAAMRGPVKTIWPNGGTVDTTLSEATEICNQVCSWYGTCGTTIPPVGSRAPNALGIYDPCGEGGQWALDCVRWNNSTRRNFPYYGRSSRTDPVGISNPDCKDYYSYRVYHSSGGFYASAVLLDQTPSGRYIGNPDSAVCGARFCIHLKELNWNVE